MSPENAIPDNQPDDVPAAKQRLRTAAKAARKAAAEADRAGGSGAAPALRDLFMARFMTRDFIRQGAASADTVVSAYWPMGDEIDPRPLLQALAAAGCRLALPALRGPGQPLDFRAWVPGDPLFPAGFGTEEPAAESPLLEPQILLVPLLAFDALGYRLGYGGGFYDRSLALLRARGDILALGLAFSAQQVGQVPRDGNDQKLDGLVTEKTVIRF